MTSKENLRKSVVDLASRSTLTKAYMVTSAFHFGAHYIQRVVLLKLLQQKTWNAKLLLGSNLNTEITEIYSLLRALSLADFKTECEDCFELEHLPQVIGSGPKVKKPLPAKGQSYCIS